MLNNCDHPNVSEPRNYTAGVCKIDGKDSYVVGFLDTKHIVAITGRVGDGNDEASQKDAIRIATLLNACQGFSTDDFVAGRIAIRKWVSCADQLPDSDTTVLTNQPGSNEPVWGGYHDGETWRNIDGPVTSGVMDWMEFPDPPSLVEKDATN